MAAESRDQHQPVSETGDREVYITRVFDAPRELVFEAWTTAEHLTRWYAPRGCSTFIRSLDFRVGGTFHLSIRTPEGRDCWCTGVYREIAAPERLVFTLGRADEAGNPVDPIQVGMDPAWPKDTVVTLTFEEHGGKTKFTLHQTVSEALAKKTGAHPSWLQMFDKLAELLAKS